jgi:hypothetical protein
VLLLLLEEHEEGKGGEREVTGGGAVLVLEQLVPTYSINIIEPLLRAQQSQHACVAGDTAKKRGKM